jgi:uncharacterized membrane protein YgcG
MIPPPPERRSTRLLLFIAIVIVLVTDVGYVLIIRSQEPIPPDRYTVVFIVAYLAVMAAMLAASVLRRRVVVRLRPALRAAAAAGLLVIGVLALASIGIPLVVAGALSTGAAVRSLAGLHWHGAISEIAAATAAIAVLVAGFEVTERMIVCPSTGSSGGSGYGLVTGGYHWSCTDGRLDFQPGYCSSGGGGVDANGHSYATGC